MTRLTLEQAHQIIAGAHKHSAASGFKPMAFVGLDEGGAAVRAASATKTRRSVSLASPRQA